MQSAGVPLVSSVIPRIDDLVRAINDFKDDQANHPAVRSAAMQGLVILNKYYQMTDESFVYRVAMGKSILPTCCDVINEILLKPSFLALSFAISMTKAGW